MKMVERTKRVVLATPGAMKVEVLCNFDTGKPSKFMFRSRDYSNCVLEPEEVYELARLMEYIQKNPESWDKPAADEAPEIT